MTNEVNQNQEAKPTTIDSSSCLQEEIDDEWILPSNRKNECNGSSSETLFSVTEDQVDSLSRHLPPNIDSSTHPVPWPEIQKSNDASTSLSTDTHLPCDDCDALSIISDTEIVDNDAVFEDSVDEKEFLDPAPPPPPPLDSSSCDEDDDSSSVDSDWSDASSVDRGQLFLPNLLQSNTKEQTNTPNSSVSVPGPPPFAGNNHLTSPPISTSTRNNRSPLSLGKGGALFLPSMFQRMRSRSTSSSDTNETGPPLIKPDTNVSLAASTSSNSSNNNNFDRFPVPAYKDQNRMLMRSPLPSPRQSPKRIIPQPRTLADDSDNSEDGRLEREETTMKRLVRMAKQQHNFAAAWFATSAGEEAILPAMTARPKRRPRPHPAALNASSVGPVDLDKELDDDSSQISTSTTSSGSSRMRSILGMILPSSSSIKPEGPSSQKRRNGGTGTVSTASPGSSNGPNSNGHVDLEAARPSNNDEKKIGGVCNRRPSFYVILVFMIVCLVCVVAASVLLATRNRNKSAPANSFQTASPTASPVPTQIPTMTAPTGTPTTSLPSSEPTLSPTMAPSASPSIAPSSMPTGQPSGVPSTAPSIAPTLSPAPSSTPSMPPTSIFSTTVFKILGSTLQGDLLQEQYGNSVSLSSDGTVLAIGARYYEQDGKRRAGRVQVFDLKGNVWAMRDGGNGDPLQSLFGRNDMDQFGFSVSLSGDGNRLAVSEPGYDGPAGNRSGNVRVFDWQNGKWVQVGTDIGGQDATDLFGYGLTLSGNGQRLAVGAPYHDNAAGSLAGRVRIFELSTDTNQWEPLGNDLDGTQSLDWFGWDIDLDWTGGTVVIGAPRNSDNGGYVRCFSLQKESWEQIGRDIVNDFGLVQLDDRFGSSVSMSADGQIVAVGAPGKDTDTSSSNAGLAAVYKLSATVSGQSWTQMGNVLEGKDFNHQLGWSVELSSSGEFLSVGAPGVDENKGQVDVHRWDGNDWDTAATPLQGVATQDEFGFSVAISDDGARLAVGAVVSRGTTGGGSGYARVFQATL